LEFQESQFGECIESGINGRCVMIEITKRLCYNVDELRIYRRRLL